tara:strand:- start:563 stop:1114 length:552 start_codon:yes stop_codon:yes gene_type:complete
MSSVKISGDTSGVITLAAPAAAGTNTITLPASTGTMALTTDGGGVTHLGTITTTGGTSQALAAQNFSLYNQIWIVTDNVSSGGSADFQVGLNGDAVVNVSGAIPAAQSIWALFRLDLRTNSFFTTYFNATSATSGTTSNDSIPTTGGYYNLSTNYRSVTSGAITIAMEGQTFDAGSAEIYGVS